MLLPFALSGTHRWRSSVVSCYNKFLNSLWIWRSTLSFKFRRQIAHRKFAYFLCDVSIGRFWTRHVGNRSDMHCTFSFDTYDWSTYLQRHQRQRLIRTGRQRMYGRWARRLHWRCVCGRSVDDAVHHSDDSVVCVSSDHALSAHGDDVASTAVSPTTVTITHYINSFYVGLVNSHRHFGLL